MFAGMDTTGIIIAIAALLLGLIIGWFAASFFGANWKERFKERDTEFKSAISELAAARDEVSDLKERSGRAEERGLRADALESNLSEARDELTRLKEERAGFEEQKRLFQEGRSEFADAKDKQDAIIAELRDKNAAIAEELATLRTGLEERERASADKLAEREKQFERELLRLTEAEEKLQAKFNEIGDKMLEGARTRFMDGAQKHLAELNKESLAALEKKVGPVGETLERYRQRVEELEKGRTDDFAKLHGVISEVKAGQQEVITGARELTTSIRGGTKTRGDWGEIQFENLLDACNLRDKTDFRREVNLKDEDGRDQRPDAIINIPGGHKLIVDVKNVHNTFRDANEAPNEEQRSVLLMKHAKEVRSQVLALAAKRYQDREPGSADFVIMFVPGEHVLYAALMQDDKLINDALKSRVVLASPLNFMSIALTIATMWRQAGVQADAEEIGKLGKDLYDQLGVVAGHLNKLRKSLLSTNQHYDALVASFDGRLRVRGERFEKLSLDTSAQKLSEALPIGHQPRKMPNFPDHEDRDAAE